MIFSSKTQELVYHLHCICLSEDFRNHRGSPPVKKKIPIFRPSLFCSIILKAKHRYQNQ